ncbi:hypothetical protein BH18THE1_BH18THE1_05630 [soil metagenome]
MEKNRPSGVTIVAVLAIVSGIILIVGAVFTIYLVPSIITSQLSNDMSELTSTNQLSPEFSTTLTGAIINIVYIVSSAAIALGIAWFGLAWGLFTAKGWAWLITVILAIISVVFSIVSIMGANITSIPIIIISGIILYYMYRPQVKSYFGRVKISK